MVTKFLDFDGFNGAYSIGTGVHVSFNLDDYPMWLRLLDCVTLKNLDGQDWKVQVKSLLVTNSGAGVDVWFDFI